MSETTQALSTFSEDQFAALRSMTGEKNKTFISIPHIRIDSRVEVNDVPNPTFGHYAIVTSEKQENGSFKKLYEPIGKTFEAVILKRRYSASRYDKNLQKTTAFTPEFDDWGDVVVLERTKDGISELGKGVYKPLKIKFNLKPKLILYVWYKEAVYKLKLPSTSLFPFGDYEKENQHTSVAAVITRLGTKKEKKDESSPIYFSGTFEKVGEFDPQKAWTLVCELDKGLRAMGSQKSEPMTANGNTHLAGAPMKTGYQDKGPAEQITVDQLPF